ncbi:hypothetical protein [Methylobacterium tardum]|uniref:hypothetical protein n=2 Tax=Methylobacterium tardum TaxID=374432 RepID=UPI00360EC8A1
MRDSDWLDAFIGSEPTVPLMSSPPTLPEADAPLTLSRASAPRPAGKKPRKDSKPWFTRFPPLGRVRAMRAQFFDNGPNPGKGNTQHTIKLRVYLGDGMPLNQRTPHWHRLVELIDPKKVVAWAEQEHAAGRIPETGLAPYREAADAAAAWMRDEPEALWAKMGHIGSPPGNHYFHGQFLLVVAGEEGMEARLHLDAEVIEIGPFYANTRSKKANAPKRHALYDPHGLVAGTEDA